MFSCSWCSNNNIILSQQFNLKGEGKSLLKFLVNINNLPGRIKRMVFTKTKQVTICILQVFHFFMQIFRRDWSESLCWEKEMYSIFAIKWMNRKTVFFFFPFLFLYDSNRIKEVRTILLQTMMWYSSVHYEAEYLQRPGKIRRIMIICSAEH